MLAGVLGALPDPSACRRPAALREPREGRPRPPLPDQPTAAPAPPRPAGRPAATAARPARAPRPPRGRRRCVASAGTMVGGCLWVVLAADAVPERLRPRTARSQAAPLASSASTIAAATASIAADHSAGEPGRAAERSRGCGSRRSSSRAPRRATLLAGPGHLRKTVLPGQVGTSVVYGRAATYGGPFGELDQLRVGDEIKVVMAQGEVLDGRQRPPRRRPLLAAAAAGGRPADARDRRGRRPAGGPHAQRRCSTSTRTRRGGVSCHRPGSRPPIPELGWHAADTGAFPLLALHLALLRRGDGPRRCVAARQLDRLVRVTAALSPSPWRGRHGRGDAAAAQRDVTSCARAITAAPPLRCPTSPHAPPIDGPRPDLL